MPSGKTWEFGPADAAQTVRGSAYDFCLLVTQRAHRDDLDLVPGGDPDRGRPVAVPAVVAVAVVDAVHSGLPVSAAQLDRSGTSPRSRAATASRTSTVSTQPMPSRSAWAADSLPGEHRIYVADVRDRDALHQAAQDFLQFTGQKIDVVIASAGISAGTLTEETEDFAVFNHYRTNGELNVHSEYGYLVNEVTATLIRDWWRSL